MRARVLIRPKAGILDPQGQVVLFMRKVLDTEFDFQERLWSALKEERS